MRNNDYTHMRIAVEDDDIDIHSITDSTVSMHQRDGETDFSACGVGSWLEAGRVGRLAVPLSLHFYAFPLMILTNAVVLGRHSMADVGAMALGNVVILSVYVFACGIVNNAAAALCNKALSDGVPQNVGLWLQSMIATELLVLLPVAAGAAYAGPGLLAGLGATAYVSKATLAAYMPLCLLWLAPSMVTATVAAWLDATHARWPRTRTAILGFAVNAACSWWLVHGSGPVRAMGIKGVPVAHAAAAWVQLIVVLVIVFGVQKHHRAGNFWPGLRLCSAASPYSIAAVLGNGIWATLFDAAPEWALQTLLLLCASRGRDDVVVYALLVLLTSLHTPLMLALGVAVSVRASAMQERGLHSGTFAAHRVGVCAVAALAALECALLYAFRAHLGRLFSDDAQYADDLQAAVPYLMAHAALVGTASLCSAVLESEDDRGSAAPLGVVLGLWVGGVGPALVSALGSHSFTLLLLALPAGQGVLAAILLLGILRARVCRGGRGRRGLRHGELSPEALLASADALFREPLPAEVRVFGGDGGDAFGAEPRITPVRV